MDVLLFRLIALNYESQMEFGGSDFIPYVGWMLDTERRSTHYFSWSLKFLSLFSGRSKSKPELLLNLIGIFAVCKTVDLNAPAKLWHAATFKTFMN